MRMVLAALQNGGTGHKWEPEEDRLLAYWQSKLGNKWAQVAKHIPDRTGQQCAQRWRHTNPSISKGKWTPEEDEQLAQLVDTCGVGHWAEIARHMAGRTDQQCLARWTRHLDPSINRGNWSEQEDALLLQLYEQYGSNWSRIAKAMKVRIPHQCRSRFNVLARGSASRSQSVGSDSQQQQQKRRRKGGAQFARIGAARWKKPKWAKADWEGESDSACDDEGTYDETGDYHDEDMKNDHHQQDADEFADDAEEAAALLTSFQHSAAAVGHSSDTVVDTKDSLGHALGTEEQQQQEQWQQQEWQQQQHWERWQQRQKQEQEKQRAVKTEHTTGYEQNGAFAAANADFAYCSASTAAAVAQVLQVHRSDEATGAAIAGQRGSSAGSSKSSSNIICRSRGDNNLSCVLSVQDPAEYSGAIAAAAAIADASSRNTSPEFVQQPVAPSGVGSSAAAAAAAAVAALLGSGGLAAAGATAAAAPDASRQVPARTAGNGSFDAAALMAALSKYAAGNAATEVADAALREPPAGAGYLSKTGSSTVPAVIAEPNCDVAGPAAVQDSDKCAPGFSGSTVATLVAAAAPKVAAAAAGFKPAGAFTLGSGAATSAAAVAPSSSQQLLLQWLKRESGEQAPPVDPLPVLPLQLSCLPQQQPALQQLAAATPGLQQLAALYTPYIPAQQQQYSAVLPLQRQQPQSILSQAMQQLGSLSGVEQQQHRSQLHTTAVSLAGSSSMDSFASGGLNLVDMVRILAAAQPPAAL